MVASHVYTYHTPESSASHGFHKLMASRNLLPWLVILGFEFPLPLSFMVQSPLNEIKLLSIYLFFRRLPSFLYHRLHYPHLSKNPPLKSLPISANYIERCANNAARLPLLQTRIRDVSVPCYLPTKLRRFNFFFLITYEELDGNNTRLPRVSNDRPKRRTKIRAIRNDETKHAPDF